jgi:hypothetical protein
VKVRWVVLLYSGLTLLYVWPLLFAFGSRLPADTGDPGLNTWILWWNAHAVPLSERWWNAPIFHPVPGAFAFSETLLSLSLVSTPAQWLGASAVTAYNLVFVLSFFSAAVGAHALAYRLTGSHGAALVAGLAFGFSPYRAAQLPHVQTLVTCWMPLALFALHRYLDTGRARALVLFGACWLLNGLTTGYFLVFFAVLLACWSVWFVRTWMAALAIAAAVLASSLPLVPWLMSYQRRQAAFGMTRSMGEIVTFSADVSALWATSAYTWLARHWTLAPRAEGELYPGVVLLALVAAGAWLSWRARRPRDVRSRGRRLLQGILFGAGALACALAAFSSIHGGWQISLGPATLSITHPFKTVTAAIWLFLAAGLIDPRLADSWRRRSPFAFYALAAAVMFAFAWGPLAQAFGARFWYQAPYAWLMRLPGGGALRVPARFATPMILCLTQAAALTVARFTRGAWRPWIVAALAIGVGLDGWVLRLKTDPVPAAIDLTGLDASVPLLEIPQTDLYADTGAMLRATRHGRTLINGYSGYTPAHYLVLEQALRDLDATVFDALQTIGPLGVFVDRARDPDGRYRAIAGNAAGSRLVRETPAGTLFALPARPAPPAAATPLTIQRVETIDSGVRLHFSTPVALSRLELDLDGAPAAYPRRLTVVADRPGEAGPLWDGSPAGAALLGALRDPARAPIPIDLSADAPSTIFTVTMRGARPEASWTVAGVRAFSRQ